MGKIIALGGGEIGRPGYPIETTRIDKEVIRLSGKKYPKILFIPTASNDSSSYYKIVKNYFGNKLSCKVSVLWLLRKKLNKKSLTKKILSSDIIYVGGGNTQKMIQAWKKNRVDRVLKQAYTKGIILYGLSAGSICWFNGGTSDVKKMINPKADLITVKGLGLIKAMHSPHYDVEVYRRPGLKKIMKNKAGVAIAIDNCCAIEIVNDQYRIISSKAKAQAYKVYWKNKKFYEKVIRKEKKFKPLNQLLVK